MLKDRGYSVYTVPLCDTITVDGGINMDTEGLDVDKQFQFWVSLPLVLKISQRPRI